LREISSNNVTHRNHNTASSDMMSKASPLLAPAASLLKVTAATLPSLSPLASSPASAAAAPPSFSPALYFSHLRNKLGGPGRELWFAEELESTQRTLLESGVNGDAGVVCVAARQTAGRGRGSNTWVSPSGCLMFSFRATFPDREGRTLPFMQYVISLCAVRAVRKSCQVDLRIKWPNDLYTDQAVPVKIGGILCQSHHEGGRFVVTTGVGLNVTNDEPTTCVARLAPEGGGASAERILAEFFNAFDELYHGVFLRGGGGGAGPSFEPLLDEYHRAWLHSGQTVMADEGRVVAVVEGISPQTGCLVARDARGPLELQPDGNRLDFFKGLISNRAQNEG
jgi:biotin--protein ligase